MSEPISFGFCNNSMIVYQLLSWVEGEQDKEQWSFTNVIDKIKLVKEAGLYLLDQEMAKRVFVDPNTQD